MTIANYLKRAIRLGTGSLRSLPGVLIIGGIRCGTTSLWEWLSHHPQLEESAVKEVHYFDINSSEPAYWYRSQFGFRFKAVTHYEATPSYMVTDGAAQQAHGIVPDAAIVALLRDPADRAWSHYRLRRSRGEEPRSFSEVVDQELRAGVDALVEPKKGTPVPYLTCGLYAEQLAAWRSAFGPEQVLLIDSSQMFAEPATVVATVEHFLGIDKVALPTVPRNAVSAADPDVEVMQRLRDFYAEPNQRLQADTGFTAAWL